MIKHKNIPENAIYNPEQMQWEIGERNENNLPVGKWNYWWAETGHLCCVTNYNDFNGGLVFSRFHPDGTYSFKGEMENDAFINLSYYQKSKNKTTELVFQEEIYKNVFSGIYDWNTNQWQFFNIENQLIDLNGSLIVKPKTSEKSSFSKIKFPNPFGYNKQTSSELENAKTEYGFSEEYLTFLKNQNGFNGRDFIDSEVKENYLTTIDFSNANQDFKTLYSFNAAEEYDDLIKNQEFNIFKDYFFIIGSDLAGNEFVEVKTGIHKGKIGCLDHDLYASCESIEKFFEDLELGNYKDTTEDERYKELFNENFGLVAFHANNMTDFIGNCFLYSEEIGVVIRSIDEVIVNNNNNIMNNPITPEIQAVFGKHQIPNALQLLYAFEEEYGAENYSQCFYLKTSTEYNLDNWCESKEFMNAFLEFATANGSGSSYAYWLIDDNLENCPIVVFGDEGGLHTVANSTPEFMQLLTLNVEISVDWDSAYFYKDDEYYNESYYKDEFADFVQENFNLPTLETNKQTETIINQAKEKHQENLMAFAKKCGLEF